MPDQPKILTVDDRPENLFALRRVLADMDVDVVEAGSGNEALAATLTADFAVAILDVHMPGMDGYELADLLRGDPRTRRLPIVFLTAAYGEQAHVFRGYEAGAVDYIVKPYDPVVLRSKISVFLELHRRSAALAEKVDALAASEERFRSLVMTVPDIVYRIDPDGRFTFLNDAVTLLGYRPSELLGLHFSEIVHPADVSKVSRREVLLRYAGRITGTAGAPKLFDERRASERKTIGLEVCLVPRQGMSKIPGLLSSLGEESIVVEVSSSGVYASAHGQGSPVFLGTVGIIRDITERKRAEDELERHRQHLQELVEARVKEQSCLYRLSGLLAGSFESVPAALQAAVAIIPSGWEYPDVACARVTVGDHCCTTTPFEESQWWLAEDISIAGEVRGRVEVFYGEQRPEADEGPFLREERALLASIASMLGQAVERQEAAAREALSAQERNRMQAQMVQSQRLEAIGTLASGVAHEINNPLNIVMNFAQLILDEEETQDIAREFATTIVAESQRMARIVRDLLAFSRNDREGHSPADVATLVSGTVSLLRAVLRRDEIDLEALVPAGLPMIRCRSQQIQQVLMNLLTNARDALNARFPGASPDKLIRVLVEPFERDGVAWVRLTVEDRGGGVPSEVADRLFDPFVTTKPKAQGTGLGLSISYGIVKDHGGKLWFESEADVGTRFHLELEVNNGWSLLPAGADQASPR